MARTFVVSPRAAWADPRRTQALREQLSLESLVLLGERLQHDSAVLLDRAAFDGEEVASASVVAEVRLAGEEARAAFLKDYLAAVGPLLERHGSAAGERYSVVLAAYPEPERKERR